MHRDVYNQQIREDLKGSRLGGIRSPRSLLYVCAQERLFVMVGEDEGR